MVVERVDAILAHLGLPTTPPPLSPRAVRPSTTSAATPTGFDFDQTPTCDLTEPEPIPDFDLIRALDQGAGA